MRETFAAHPPKPDLPGPRWTLFGARGFPVFQANQPKSSGARSQKQTFQAEIPISLWGSKPATNRIHRVTKEESRLMSNVVTADQSPALLCYVMITLKIPLPENNFFTRHLFFNQKMELKSLTRWPLISILSTVSLDLPVSLCGFGIKKTYK